MPDRNRTRSHALLLLAVFVLAGGAWATLRINIESAIAEAAQRDLHTIIDLVASDLRAHAAARPGAKGLPLARAVTASGGLAGTLQRANSERLRQVYFFDAAGRVAAATLQPSPVAGEPSHPAVPEIVRVALANAASTDLGILIEPYRGAAGSDAIGAWQWLPALEVGIVAERPYAGFGRPLFWIDGVFFAVLALVVLGALWTNVPWLHEIMTGWRQAPARCGPYLIGSRIGEGAMADVYVARHRHLGRTVALKLLKGGAQTDEGAARFDREARLASRLAHPNIVTILDHGRAPEGGFFYAMEYIRGFTLPQWVAEHGPIPPARSVRILQQLCAALGAIHHAGFLHRDIKPDNVMAFAANDDYDLVKLIDFGLVKGLAGDETRDLTRNLRVLGTPAYMAPERLTDPRCIDPRTDLYGLGCVAFYILTGRKPFEAGRDGDLAQQVLHVEAPRVSMLAPFQVPARLDALVASLLAKRMEARPATAAAVGGELDAIAHLVPWERERAKLWWRSVGPPVPEA